MTYAYTLNGVRHETPDRSMSVRDLIVMHGFDPERVTLRAHGSECETHHNLSSWLFVVNRVFTVESSGVDG